MAEFEKCNRPGCRIVRRHAHPVGAPEPLYSEGTFKNELGNEIIIKLAACNSRGLDAVLIEVIGPHSQSTNVLTAHEFEYLASMSNAFVSRMQR